MDRRHIRIPDLPYQRKKNAAYSELAEAPDGVPISAHGISAADARNLRHWSTKPRTGNTVYWLVQALPRRPLPRQPEQVGVVRRDPMAMKPFCGYNFADYWNHWLSLAEKSDKLPKSISRQLVSPGRQRQIPLAWFRREPARTSLDHRSMRRAGFRTEDPNRVPAGNRRN